MFRRKWYKRHQIIIPWYSVRFTLRSGSAITPWEEKPLMRTKRKVSCFTWPSDYLNQNVAVRLSADVTTLNVGLGIQQANRPIRRSWNIAVRWIHVRILRIVLAERIRSRGLVDLIRQRWNVGASNSWRQGRHTSIHQSSARIERIGSHWSRLVTSFETNGSSNTQVFLKRARMCLKSLKREQPQEKLPLTKGKKVQTFKTLTLRCPMPRIHSPSGDIKLSLYP